MTEMFVQLKLGDQRYKSKVSSVNCLRSTRPFIIKELKKKNVFHFEFHKKRRNLVLALVT